MMTARYTLGKTERLKRRKIIEQLFSEGKAISAGTLRAVYKDYEGVLGSPLQAAFSASSRQFKRSVQRNRIKRLMREAYRTQKSELSEKMQATSNQLAVFFIYTGREMPDHATLHEHMRMILNKLVKRFHEASGPNT